MEHSLRRLQAQDLIDTRVPIDSPLDNALNEVLYTCEITLISFIPRLARLEGWVDRPDRYKDFHGCSHYENHHAAILFKETSFNEFHLRLRYRNNLLEFLLSVVMLYEFH